jgi:hypothetical protein
MEPILSREDIEEFRQIWRDEFHEELSIEKAPAIAERFLSALHQIVTHAERVDRRAAKQSDSSST